MEVDLIIKMGFFVRALHNHIVTLHTEQYGGQNHSDSFTVYRGQDLPQMDFDQLRKTQSGLLSFNNFLSTSKNRDVSLDFAQRTIVTSSLVGLLFTLKIDPSITTTPFVNVQNVSYYQTEEEILFSMYSVFRIGQVQQIEKNDRLLQVDLTLTGDNDSQSHTLTEQMRKETGGSTGWHRIGKLMIQIGQFNKAEELYEILLKQSNNEDAKAHLYYQLGWTKNDQGKYTEAIGVYEKALEISQKTLSENHPDLATSYNNIGTVYNNMGEYLKALPYLASALDILQRSLPSNNPHLQLCKDNLELVKKKI